LQPNGFQSEPKAPPLSHKEEHDEEAVIDAPLLEEPATSWAHKRVV